MAELGPVAAFGVSLGGPLPPPGAPGALRELSLGALRAGGRRLRRLRVYPAGPQTWLFLGGALGLCEAAGLDPSLGVVGAIEGGLPHSPLLPGGVRGVLALLLFASGLWLLLGLILRLGLRLLLGGAGGALGRAGPPPRLWMALVRMFAGRRPGLHSFQGVLPPLPLPPLDHTVQKAVLSLQELGPGGGREQLPGLARSFLGGAGPQLQRWLRLRAWLLPSYLSELWEEQIHLGGRRPLPTCGNFYLMDVLGPPPTRVRAARAANLTLGLLKFRSLLLRGSLPPVLFRGTLPTCSAQYLKLFNTCRLPGHDRDRLQHRGGGSHVAVLFRGGLFRVPVTRGGGRLLPPRELQLQFQRVLEQGEGGGGGQDPPKCDPQETPAVLTAGDRPTWAWSRAELEGGGANGPALQALDSAPFVVAIDDHPPPGTPPQKGFGDPPEDGELDEEAKELLLGPPHNRWFDKSLTLVVLSSGRVGLNVEHSWGDPPVAGHLWEFALATERLELGYDGGGHCRGGLQPGVPPPERLHWELPPRTRGALGGALGAARALASDLQLHVLALPPPPGPPHLQDALTQLGLQLALLRERGPALSYRVVSTRLFEEGRGEGVRGCGAPLRELEAALRDPNTGRGRRRALLGVAVRAELELQRLARSGAGLDRHLQALAAVANQLRLRPPFLVEVLSQPWALASSPAPRAEPPLLPHPLRLAGGGFGPPHPDGYGVSYTQGAGPDDVILVHVSCRVSSPLTDALRFSGQLREALAELAELWGGGEGLETPPQ